MSICALADALPGYAREVGANVAALLDETLMADARKSWPADRLRPWHGLSAAGAGGRGGGVRARRPDVAEAARAAAAAMAMTNVSSPLRPSRLEQGLRADADEAPPQHARPSGAGTAEYELFALAVSAMNGCGLCIDSHEQAPPPPRRAGGGDSSAAARRRHPEGAGDGARDIAI